MPSLFRRASKAVPVTEDAWDEPVTRPIRLVAPASPLADDVIALIRAGHTRRCLHGCRCR